MAHINLLPWRESRRAEHKKNYLTLLVALTTIAFSLMFIAGNVLDKMTGNQNYRNNFIEQQTAILDKQIKKIKNIQKNKKIAILVGGTGLYFQSLINGLVRIPEIPLKFRNKVRLMSKKEGQKKFYKKLLKLDPKIKDKFDPNDTQRSIRAYEIKSYTGISMYDWLTKTKSEFKDSDFLKLYIETKREKLIERINLRTFSMISGGAINEVKKFLKLKIRKDQSVNKVIGIAELTQYLNDEISLAEAKELILIKTRQYAKRQATWARTRMMSWIKIDPSKVDSYIKKLKKSSLKLDQLT